MTVGNGVAVGGSAGISAVSYTHLDVYKRQLHNYDEIARKDIRIGDRVLVKRAGDVIPYVVGPIVDARDGSERPIERPAVCPVCGQPIVQLPDEVALYCENAACPEQLIRRVEYFVSRGAMDITSFGSQTAALLFEQGLIHDVADIYTVQRDDLLGLEAVSYTHLDVYKRQCWR